jgi:hypothetical protein
MIIVQLNGGLGNQLFQYAFARCLAEKRNTRLLLDISVYNSSGLRLHEFYALEPYNIHADIANYSDVSFFYPKNVFQKYRKKFMYFLGMGKIKQVYEKKWFTFDAKTFSCPDSVYLCGFWQSEKYFKDIETIIREEFSLRNPLTQNSLNASRKINSRQNTVSLHIRRGDYVSDTRTNSLFGVCSLEYYRNCISYLEKKLGFLNIFIFSDDPSWVKENFHIKHPHFFIDHNGVKYAYEDMYLMSLCEHNIIANSSFSWWGAWLNKNSNKIICTPKNWTKLEDTNCNDLIPEGWIRL